MADNTHEKDPRRNAPTISLTPVNRSPGKLLRDAHLLLSAGLAGALEQAGHPLPTGAWAALNVLWEVDNLPQPEIGARISRDRHQTSRLVDCLAGQRFVKRKSVAGDRRVKRVALTDTGRAAQSTLQGVATEYFEDIFTGVTQEDYDGFIRCLRHVVDRLRSSDEEQEDVA